MFERVVSALFGSAAKPSGADQQLIRDMTDAFVEAVEPRVRLSSRYREQLAGNVARTVSHLRELGAQMPSDPVALSRAAWSGDPRVRTFFAAADDVAACIGRSDEVREFFDTHSQCTDVYALLGMQRKERTVLAARLEGDVLRQDVQQTTINFSGHRLLAVAPDMAQARLEVGRRIIERLAQLVLTRLLNSEQQLNDLHLRKAMLNTRLRMLRSARDGMAPLVEQGLTIGQQIVDVERELKETADDYTEARSSVATHDGTVDLMNAVLAHPEQQVALAHLSLRVNRMGVKIEPGQSGEADSLDLTELSIGDGQQATIAFVHIQRNEVPPREDLLSQAVRTL